MDVAIELPQVAADQDLSILSGTFLIPRLPLRPPFIFPI
jgi:hypothetical protein